MHPEAQSSADAVLHGIMQVGRMLRRGLPGEDQLDPGTFWLLKAVGTHGPLRVTELAGHVGLDPSTVSRHVAQLHRAGLLDRTPDPADGRAQLIAVSAEGRRRLQAAYEQRRDLLSRSLTGWDTGDVADFERLLTQFVRSLEFTSGSTSRSTSESTTAQLEESLS